MSAQKRSRLLSAIINQNADDSSDEMEKLVDILEEELQQKYEQKHISILCNTIRSTMLEIAKVKEMNQERRHRELVQLLEKYLSFESETQSTPSEKIATEKLTNVELHVSETSTQPATNTTLEDVRELLMKSSATGKNSNEFIQMRENMLDVQRQKMAERKSKKRKLVT